METDRGAFAVHACDANPSTVFGKYVILRGR
jgi:hypothetical protein